MPHKLRKIRKTRGSRTQGWGRVGQHRRTGSKGRRNPGRHKGSWSYVTNLEVPYFGKTGFTSPKSLKQEVNPINVGSLDLVADRVCSGQERERLVIDLQGLGYTKLLGTGKVTRPLVVKVASCSKLAADKVKRANGEVLTESKEEEEQEETGA